MCISRFISDIIIQHENSLFAGICHWSGVLRSGTSSTVFVCYIYIQESAMTREYVIPALTVLFFDPQQSMYYELEYKPVLAPQVSLVQT